MDPQSRQTASAYINNLLLSRGLLRNGIPIEFAMPEAAEGGLGATMAQVMNLVHDLILRRDREADTLSTLSHNIQTLRTSSTQHTHTVERLQNHNADLERQLALTSAQERAARATLRSAETRNRALREEMARLKSTVAQIRAHCATDVRRRDGEIQRLKRHLEGRRGREGSGGQVGVVVVTPGMSKTQHKSTDIEADLDSPEYSLKQETTEFLTQLSQGLSDENDALIGLVRGTLRTLRSLQGLPTDSRHESDFEESSEGTDGANILMQGPPSYEALAASTYDVLEHLRGLLTNPSFVPLEEVEMREEEIHRLREGWEMMAMRWKEAVSLMVGWKKRMMGSGDTINLDDLKVGLKLGSGIPSAQEARQSPSRKDALANESPLPESDDLKDLEEDLRRACAEVEDSREGVDAVEDAVELDVSAANEALGERSGNARLVPSRWKESFLDVDEENGRSFGDADDASLLESAGKAQMSPSKTKSRIPLQILPSRSPTRTVAQKLDMAQKEAEEVRKKENHAGKRNISHHVAVKKSKGRRRRSTLSPEELEILMGAA